jgi:hypothetical protein
MHATEYDSLVGLHIIADNLQDTKLKNFAVEGMVNKDTNGSSIKNSSKSPSLPSPLVFRKMYYNMPYHCPVLSTGQLHLIWTATLDMDSNT